MKKHMNMIGILILLGIFLIFYLVATYCLDRRKLTKEVPPKEDTEITEGLSYEDEKNIVKKGKIQKKQILTQCFKVFKSHI